MTDHTDEPGAERRRSERHATEGQSSSLGEVLDLSRVGARVGGEGKPPLKVGETMTLGLVAPEGTLRVPARVVWVRRKRFRHWEMGLEFVDVDLRKQVAVERLARFGCLSVPVGSEAEAAEAEALPRPRPRPQPRVTPAAVQTTHGPSGRTASDGRTATTGGRAGRIHATYEERDHYRLLQVQADADEETIRLAFRMLAKRLHPDRNPAPDAHRRFEVIKQAYDVLRDADRRAAYDRARRGEGPGNAAA